MVLEVEVDYFERGWKVGFPEGRVLFYARWRSKLKNWVLKVAYCEENASVVSSD